MDYRVLVDYLPSYRMPNICVVCGELIDSNAGKIYITKINNFVGGYFKSEICFPLCESCRKESLYRNKKIWKLSKKERKAFKKIKKSVSIIEIKRQPIFRRPFVVFGFQNHKFALIFKNLNNGTFV